MPVRSKSSFAAEILPTRLANRDLSTVMIWDTFATDSFGSPVALGERDTFPGARAHLRFEVSGTQTTVAIRLRFNASP
jgi:hypothetical protein